MIQKKGKCSFCGIYCNIANSKYNLCFRCNNLRRMKDKAKVNSEPSLNDFYLEIWNSRKHKCELTGQDLEWIKPKTDIWRSCFAHIFAKSKFPNWKFLDINILLVHPDIHHLLDNGTYDKLKEVIGDNGLEILNKRKSKILNKINYE